MELGIIPAYAGSTIDTGTEAYYFPGSSPRMRGAPGTARSCKGWSRIIPAYAGSTMHTARRWNCAADHPRVCGEHDARGGHRRLPLGSSPRMRGAPGACLSVSRPRRIIPAYAGSTRGWKPLLGRGRDHPRVCGEHASLVGLTTSPRGSSPRMRGAPDTDAINSNTSRIIPAYAGSTRRLSTRA